MTSLAKLPWFRHYTDLVRDRKIRRQSYAIRWVWITVLTAAAESPRRGHLLLADGAPLDADDLADIGALKVSEVRAGLKTYETLGMLEHDPDTGAWVVVKWHQRQFTSDTSTARTRAFRERQKGQQDLFEGDTGNVPGTPGERSRNGPETETETEAVTSSSNSRESAPTPAEEAARILSLRDVERRLLDTTRPPIKNVESYARRCATQRLPACTEHAFIHPTHDPLTIANAIDQGAAYRPPPTEYQPDPPTEPAPPEVVAAQLAAARAALPSPTTPATKEPSS